MDFLRQKLSWAKENPDLSLPVALIVVVALGIGAYLLLGSGGSPYPGLKDPEKPAITVSAGKSRLTLTRQDMRALQEAELRGISGWKAPAGGDPELFKRSIVEFCAEVEDGSDTQAACRSLVNTTAAQQKREGILYLWSYIALGRKLSGSDKGRIYNAGMINYKRLAGASSDSKALNKLGLSRSAAQAVLVGKSVFEQKVSRSVDTSPSEAELRRFYEQFKFRYASQPEIKFQAMSFPSRQRAEGALSRLGDGQSWSEVAPLEFKPVLIAPGDLPPGVGERLMSLPLKTPVLFKEKGVWSVGRATWRKPAGAPPAFTAVRQRVKKDFISYQVSRSEKRLAERLYRQFSRSSRCEGGCPRPLYK